MSQPSLLILLTLNLVISFCSLSRPVWSVSATKTQMTLHVAMWRRLHGVWRLWVELPNLCLVLHPGWNDTHLWPECSCYSKWVSYNGRLECAALHSVYFSLLFFFCCFSTICFILCPQISPTSVQYFQQDDCSNAHVPIHVSNLNIPGSKHNKDTFLFYLLYLWLCSTSV